MCRGGSTQNHGLQMNRKKFRIQLPFPFEMYFDIYLHPKFAFGTIVGIRPPDSIDLECI